MLSDLLKELHESREWENIVKKQKKLSEERNSSLLDWSCELWEKISKADLIRKEIAFIEWLINACKKVKDKTLRLMLIDDLNKSINWRTNILLGYTNEMWLERLDLDYFYKPDVYRKYNFWLECLENLPNKLAEIEAKKEEVDAQIEVADLDESYNALSNLSNGL